MTEEVGETKKKKKKNSNVEKEVFCLWRL